MTVWQLNPRLNRHKRKCIRVLKKMFVLLLTNKVLYLFCFLHEALLSPIASHSRPVRKYLIKNEFPLNIQKCPLLCSRKEKNKFTSYSTFLLCTTVTCKNRIHHPIVKGKSTAFCWPKYLNLKILIKKS